MKTMQWSTGMWQDQIHCECIDCRFDSLGVNAQAKMRTHCEHTGHGVAEVLGIEDVCKTAHSNGPLTVTITLGYLCWNTSKVSCEGVAALIEEAARLESHGARVNVYVVDNGSTDDTVTAVYDTIMAHPLGSHVRITILPLTTNLGISKARNFILDWAKEMKSQFVLLMDGDIEVVPYSVYHMSRYLLCHNTVGCIGAYSANFTKKRGEEAAVLTSIPESRVKSDIHVAWTQYGLFRMTMFEDGIRFDSDGVFGKPGWGYEDDDLCYQMTLAGWKNCYFGNMCYLHRGLHSSWSELGKIGVSVKAMFKARKERLIEKWKGTKLDNAILNSVRAQGIPTLPD